MYSHVSFDDAILKHDKSARGIASDLVQAVQAARGRRKSVNDLSAWRQQALAQLNAHNRPVFRSLPEPNRAWLLVVYVFTPGHLLC